MKTKHIYKLLLSLIFFTKFAIGSEGTDICQIANCDDISAIQNIHEEIHKKALKQSIAIDLFISDLSQVVKTDKIKIKTKDKFNEFIADTISTIKEIKKENHLDNINNTLNLLSFNKLIIDSLQKAVNSKLSKFEKLPKFEIIEIDVNNDKLDLAQACFILENNREYLENIKKSLAKFNLTKTNHFMQNAEKLLRHWKLLKIGKRLTPYVLIGLTLLLRKIVVEKLLNGPTITPSQDNSENTPESDQTKQATQTTTQIEAKITTGTSTGTSASISSKIIPDQKDQAGKGNLALIPGVLHLDGKPILEIGLSLFFADRLKEDAKDLGSWSVKQIKKFAAYVKGEKGPSEVIKKPKLTFEDTIGFDSVKAEFKKVANYFKEKQVLDFVDSFVDHNYLLVGPSDIGANLADALANEITKVISIENKSAFCGIYEVNSYKLIDKKFTDIIKEAEDHDHPCIIILRNLEWITKHKKNKAKIWANIIEGFNGLRNQNKQIFIVATASKIDENLAELNSLVKIINLQNPTADQRKEFFKKKLLERSVDIADFDIENLAKLTEDCSYEQLTNIFRLACNKAHDAIEQLNQKHIEQSINEFMGLFKVATLLN